jgi:APA family basic amino acid/polyamine antiporter
VQIATTVLKILPLIAVIVALLLAFGSFGGSHASTANVADVPVTAPAIAGAAALSLFAMLGFESGTVPAGRVKDPHRTIARATMIGTFFVGIVYVLVTLAVFLMLPSEVAGKSGAPLSDLIARVWGGEAGKLIAAFAAISGLGALNGWVFLVAEIPLVLAERGVFPRIFARVNKGAAPVYGHIMACAFSLVLIATNLSGGMVGIYSFMILLATVANLVLYFATTVAMLTLIRRGHARGPLLVAAAVLGTMFALWAFYGAGLEATGWGAALVATGIPVYLLMRSRGGNRRSGAGPSTTAGQ